ncbi:MAG: MoaD/ThiS family protein [Chloroflexota bacterium]|nr:MoaD/ThiS family protein [Chloroflexota bacterium]
MRVTIEVMGPLRKLLPKGESSTVIELQKGSKVGDAVKAVGVPDEEPWSASIQGQLVEVEHPLKDGDRMLVFAPIEGGCR